MTEYLSDTQIKQLTTDLNTLKEELHEALDSAAKRAEIVELDQQLVGRVSRIDALQQQQMAKANSRQYQMQLVQIKAALKRVNTGDYGYCQNCNEFIAYSRLNARPESPLCIACQEKSET